MPFLRLGVDRTLNLVPAAPDVDQVGVQVDVVVLQATKLTAAKAGVGG